MPQPSWLHALFALHHNDKLTRIFYSDEREEGGATSFSPLSSAAAYRLTSISWVRALQGVTTARVCRLEMKGCDVLMFGVVKCP